MPLKSAKVQTEDEYWAKLYDQPEPSAEIIDNDPAIDANSDAGPSEDGNFYRGLLSGKENLQATGGGIKALAGGVTKAAGVALGSEDLAQYGGEMVDSGMEVYQRNMAEAEQYIGDTPTIADIDSVGEAGEWFSHALGQSLPDLALALGTGGLGGMAAKKVVGAGATALAEKKLQEQAVQSLLEKGIEKKAAEYLSKEMSERFVKDSASKAAVKGSLAGVAAYSGVQGGGSSFATILEETGVEAPLTAVGLGVITAGLEALPFGKAFGAMFPKGSKDEFLEYVAAGVADSPSWKKLALDDLMYTAGHGAWTEAVQFIINQEATTFVNNRYGEQAAREYGTYVKTKDGFLELLDATAKGTVPALALGAGTVAYKKQTGQYDQNFGPEADSLRTESGRNDDVRQLVIETFDRYKKADESGETVINIPDQSFLEDNPPLTADERRDAGLSEIVDYDATNEPIQMPEESSLGPPIQGVTGQDNSEFGENTLPPAGQPDIVNDFPAATPFGSRAVPSEGGRGYGNDHTFDAPMSPQGKPVQDQLVELSVAASTPEALDPNNKDVVIEAIDADDVDRVFDRNESLKIKLDTGEMKSLPTIEESYGDDAPAVTAMTAGVMADLSANGVPTSFIDSVSGVYVHKTSELTAPALTGPSSRGISINEDLINSAMTDNDALSELGWTMAHEVYHAADFALDLSSGDSRFNIQIVEDSKDPSVVMGDIMEEIYDNWENGTDLGKRFDYPFNDLSSDIFDLEQDNTKLNKTYREEVFAQLGALFHSNPKQLQEQAPLAYDYIKNIRDNNLQTAKPAEVIDETTQSESPADTSQPEGISGEVRAPPESRIIESVQPDAVGRDGEESSGGEPADTRVAGSQQAETGERERSAVQEPSLEASDPDRTPVVLKATDKKPTFKKAENYDDTGNYIVTFADGDRYTLYFDDDANEAGDEVYFTSEDGKITALDGMLGESRLETIEIIQQHRQDLIAAGENSYNTPLDSEVSTDTSVAALEFIDAEGEVSVQRLRQKFKRLEDNQFNSMLESILNDEDSETVRTGDTLSSQEYLDEQAYDSDMDDLSFIKKGGEYLLEESKGELLDKKSVPVKNITAKTNSEDHLSRVDSIVANHPNALASPEAWRAFERDLTRSNTTIAPPYALIELFNNPEMWAKKHSSLTPQQLEAADRGLATAQRMGDLYQSGDADAEATGKLLLWGLMSRMLTASAQEAGFVDLLTNSTAVTDLIDKALTGSFTDQTATRMVEVPKTKKKPKHMAKKTMNADIAEWRDFVQKAIPKGSFGRSGTSNANDFGALMLKLSALDDEGVSKLQRLHNLMADRAVPTAQVRRQFQAIVQGSGIDNKVFSFAQLMIGRDDVVILDRIQLNSMWDSERYGKNIYDDISLEFGGLHGAARYEVIENALQTKIKDLYTRLGRPKDASVGRYHWESWVRDSGQIVAHPTMQGLEKDIKGEKNPYAFLGAPEGKLNTYAYSAIYGRDDQGTPYYVYPDSKGTFHRFNLGKWDAFKKEIKKPANGIVNNDFKVSEFDKGIPWYESDQVNRQKLDDLVESYAERKAVENEYSSERAVTSSATDGNRLDQLKRTYKELRSARSSDSDGGANESGSPRLFRRRTGKHSQVLVAGQKLSGSKRELETSAKAALQDVKSFNGTIVELASNKTNAKLFASKMQASKDASPYSAAVYVYAESDYQNMKMFMTEDGSAGIAIEDGDTIVSLFSNGTNKNVTFSLASLAIEEGGIYSDAFDTQLPYIYEDVGFKVVSRLKWNDEKAPSDWDKGQFKAFNKGEPDVVFMAVDPDYFGPYSKDVGYYVEDYDEGMRSIRETRRPEQERISPKLKQAVQDRIDRNITAAELNDIFRKEGRYVKPMHPDMIAPLKSDGHYINALAITNKEGVDKKTGKQKPRKETYWMADALVDGERYGSRLDIPAYKDPDKYERADIVTMHTPKRNGNNVSAGARLGYYPTVQLRGVLFSSPEKATTKIAIGAEKNTIATIEGNYVAADHEQNRLDFIAAMDDPAWTQISMNPERHSFYYDLATQTPVKSASEIIQVGNLVIAKDAVYDDVEEFSYIKKKQINKETNTLDDGSPSTSQFTYNDEIDSQADLVRRLKDNKIYKSLVDKYAQLEDFESQAADYLGVGRLPATISPRDQENLMHGKVQEDLNKFHGDFVDPLGDLIAEAGFEADAVGLYLLAKHAPERNAAIAERVKAQREKNIATTEREINRLLDDVGVDHTVALETQREKLNNYQTIPLPFEGTGSGMTEAQSQAILNTAEREGTAKEMEVIASKVYEMLAYQRDLMVEYGLLDELSKEDWEERFEFYVPLKGFYDEENQDKFKRGIGANGFSIVGSESMKAKGRKTLPANPLLMALEDVQKKIIRARKNEASQTLLTLLSDLGDSQSYNIYNNKYRPMMDSDPLTMQDMKQMSMDRRVNGDNKYIQVKKGGQTFFIEFESDTLNAALQDMSVAALNNSNDAMNVVLRGLTQFQTFRRNMLINYNPSWGLVNPIRDVQTALIYTLSEQDKKGSRINGENVIGAMAKDYFPAMRSLYRFYRQKPARDGSEMDRYAAEFHQDGAATGLVLLKDQDEQLRILKNKLKRGYTREALTAIGKWVEDFNTTMENSIRLSAYVQARKSGTDRSTAATLAKDLTVNFNRKGESTAQVNAMYLFFNAAVQGNVNMAQALASGEVGGKKKKVTNARLAAGGLVAMGAAMALMNMWNSEEDDDGELKYQDLPEHAKNRVQLFMYGSEEGFALPMAYGLNFFTNIGRLGAEMSNGIISPEEGGIALWENFILNFVPVAPSSGENWEEKMRGFYPDILETHLDMLANKNFFGSQIFIEQNPLFVERSKAYVGRRSTPDLYKNLAEFMNDATGGDEYKDGDIFGMNTAFNPDKMEYIFEYLTGGVGRFGMQTFDAAGKILDGRPEDIEARKVPLFGTFFKQRSEYEDRFEFYDNWDSTRQIVSRFKDANGDSEEINRLREEYQHYAPLLDRSFGYGKKAKSLYELANKDLKAISATRKIIEKQSIDEDRRRVMLDKLDVNEAKIFDLYNKAFREAKELSK